MKTSEAGRQAIMRREGVRLHAYKDQRGIWTIFVGHTSAAGAPHVCKGMSGTMAEADETLSRDLLQFEDAVNHAVKKPMMQNEFDAMVSLAFNIGAHGFTGSTVVHRFNLGEKEAAADAFLMWEHPPSLKRRREDERRQFLSA